MDNRKYPIEMGWQVLFKDMNISPQDVLRHAALPLDLLSRKSPTITGKEYFRLWDGLTAVLRDNPTFPLKFAKNITPETFSPPIFACFCSPNLNVAATRIAHYKPLVGPLRLIVQTSREQTTIKIDALPEYGELPPSLIAAELAWWVHMPRLATRERLVPQSLHTTVAVPEQAVYEEYFGVGLTRSTFNGVTFSAQDAQRPFLTASDAMWSIFEPQLNQRMQDLAQNATFTEKVRACLVEILASGQYNVDDVASRLAVSRRTLQRHLRNEGTNFQQVLDDLREELARHYLAKSAYSSGQIGFLLGYEDPNSFYRAFRSWTGQTPEVVRTSFLQ
ncbi:MAG: AraC family transcriptional regulator ligand-binding domain-containing protein [Ardenticatenaceae bacterium]|nr:AraC family transcriptional regulator ligand-binding domain-containing protein [Ardenticatenaceae bacterium]